MSGYEGAIQNLIDELGKLPGVGPKSAQRLAFFLLEQDKDDVLRLVEAIRAVQQNVRFCEVCGNVTETPTCSICMDERRDNTQICVVEEPKDVQAVERTRVFHGKYHVLGGAIDPLKGIGPEQLRIRQLMSRLSDGQVSEIIMATNPTIEGEATIAYIGRMLSTMDVKVTRLASGLPVGADLEYADDVTLGRALEGRRDL